MTDTKAAIQKVGNDGVASDTPSRRLMPKGTLDQKVIDQIDQMTDAGDLRTCEDCGAWVCSINPTRDWPGYETKCGKLAVRHDACPEC